MNLNEEQKLAVESTENRILVAAGGGSGKCQPDYTLIPTPDGLKRLDSLVVGDVVYGRNGQEERIEKIFPQGEREIYEVELADGRIVECCKDHLWSYDNGHSGFTTHTLEEILSLGYKKADNRGGIKYTKRIPNLIKPVPFKTRELEIDPYVLGCFLGDGCCTENNLTLSSNDEELIKEVSRIIRANYHRRSKYNYSWDFFKEEKHIRTKEFFKNYLDNMCCYCGEKSIPSDYLFSSINQRISLLQGLMDTDGYVGDGRHSPSFATTSKKLAEDVQFLSRSLGYHSCIYAYERKDKKNIEYEVKIFTGAKNVYKIFRLSRKKNKALTFKFNGRIKHNFESIVDIRATGRYTSMRCILVDDPEHLYLTNDFVVTHNTRTIMARIRFLLEGGIDPDKIFAITFTNAAAEEMKNRLPDSARNVFIGTIHSLANRILLSNGIMTGEQIENQNFDWLLEEIYKRDLYMPDVEHLLVDEFQDVCENEYNFMMKDLKPKNFFLVGDDQQCQPAGTKVKLRNGIIKNIEDLEIGDSVIWYDNNKSYLSGDKILPHSVEKKIKNIAVRDFCDENLITIITENGETTKYTPNHITFVKMNKTEQKHIVYLMCDDNYRFRIGKIPLMNLNTCHSNPWRDKMNAEGCSKIWFLKIFDNDLEARVYEAKMSYEYQIPQTCWQIEKVKWTKEHIDYIYENLDTKSNADRCLRAHGKSIQYPLLENKEGSSSRHFAYNAVTEIDAVNLEPEIMSVIVYDPTVKSKKNYQKIVEVKKELITTPIKVYSLDIEGETYVADNIVTHNCIYSFKGGSRDFFWRMVKDPSVQVFELHNNYRCGSAIIEYAEDILCSVDDLYRVKNVCKCGRRGYVEVASFDVDKILSEFEYDSDYSKWFVLCRTNQEVDDMLTLLEKNGVPCESFKRADLDLSELKEKMEENTVKVLTIHTSKGLENDNVMVVGAHRWNDEEKRIAYVAATRARKLLVWFIPKKKPAARKKKVSFMEF